MPPCGVRPEAQVMVMLTWSETNQSEEAGTNFSAVNSSRFSAVCRHFYDSDSESSHDPADRKRGRGSTGSQRVRWRSGNSGPHHKSSTAVLMKSSVQR